MLFGLIKSKAPPSNSNESYQERLCYKAGCEPYKIISIKD
jgi:hypothetical protein